MCDMQTESLSLTRRVLNWVRSVCPLWQARKAVKPELVVLVRVIDIYGDPASDVVWPMPIPGGSWRFFADEYPDRKIVDINVSPGIVYVFTEKKEVARGN